MRFTTFLFGAVLAAQAPTLPHVVLTELSGATAARLIAVDPVTGAATALAGFPSDALTPLAVTLDLFDGAMLVALDQGGGQSRIVRLEGGVGGFVEYPIAVLPGRVAELAIVDGDLFVAVDAANGGLYRVPRRGGVATLVLPQANLTAMHALGPVFSVVMLAWTGRPGTSVPDSGTGMYSVTTGQFFFGPSSFPNPNAVEVTGVIDLPTGVPRQLLSFSDGSFALFAGLIGSNLQPIPTTPPVPPGGAVAMHPASTYSISGMTLGGAPHPFLYEVDAFTGNVTMISVALPGSPVDFTPGIPLNPRIEFFGATCGAQPLSISSSGWPQLGTTFSVGVHGQVGTPVFLAAGLSDFGGGALPFVLPGGCLLEVRPDTAVFAQLGPNGSASFAMNLPAASVFAGTVLFFQWVHFDAAGLSTSNAAAFWVGF